MNRFIVGTIVASTLSAGIGLVSGYFFAKTRLEKKYAEELKKEIEYSKAFYAKMHKRDAYETPEKAVKELIPEEAVEALLSYQGRETVRVDYHAISKGEQVVKNIFSETSSTDIEREIANRTEEAPYIISLQEYQENENEYDQSTLTYYEADQVLADEKEEHIPNADDVVGDNNLPRFGHRSNDPDTLYVRNDALSMEFEIIRKTGKYKEIVLGMTD
jgi:hypothetical protein